MKTSKTRIIILLFLFFCFMPHSLQADNINVQRWTSGPWQLQDMIPWGSDKIVIDFGINGLWNFDGAWVQLSRWNPKKMAAWGKGNLIIDFGSHGLWNFDGSSWQKIALGEL